MRMVRRPGFWKCQSRLFGRRRWFIQQRFPRFYKTRTYKRRTYF